MNTRTLFHLTAIALLAMATVAALMGSPSLPATQASLRIVDLPAITVRPAAEDAAYYQAHKIVDLAAVTVYPDITDLAFLVADTARSIDCLC